MRSALAVGRSSRARMAAPLAQDPAPDRDDQPGLLGDRDEVERRDQALLGVAPAQQRLDAGDGAVGEADRPAGSAARTGRSRAHAGGRCAAPAGRRRPRASPARRAGTRPCRRAWRCTSRRRRRGSARRRRARRPARRPRCRCCRSASPRAVPACIGRASSSRMRCAASAAAWLSSTSSSRTANSSPPKRAATSAPRTLSSSRRANSTSTSSPAAWPSESLTVLKSSRSRKITAGVRPSRRGAGDRLAHLLGEHRAVGEPGDGVVERLVRELGLERLALADVARVEQDPADVLVVDQVREQDLELARVAVAAGQRALERLDPLARRGHGHAAREPLAVAARPRGGRSARPTRSSAT